MQSLSEAHDDHMHQMAATSNPAHNSALLHRDSAPAGNDPWHAAPPTPHQTELDDRHQMSSASEIHPEEYFVSLEEERSGLSRYVACLVCSCWRREGGGGRAGGGAGGMQMRRYAPLSVEEEGEYLLDCDELALAHGHLGTEGEEERHGRR